MEYQYSSYPDSGDSSPRSREIDPENASWDESLSNYKVKFMCSYGGKIHPRPHDNQLAYVGGDTKILAVDRNVRFSGIVLKLSSLCDSDVCFKYQLPGEDLDALISVTNDEDLEHMMLEYDRLHRASVKPARLRLFLFPLNPPISSNFPTSEPKNDGQWFVDALNSAPIQTVEASSPTDPPPLTSNPDFLFGLDKGFAPPQASKLQDQPLDTPVPEPNLPSEIRTGSDTAKEDQQIGVEPVASPVEIQKQIEELQRLKIASQEQQAIMQKKNEEAQARAAYQGDYYMQKVQEKPAAPAPAAYWQERHMTAGGYTAAAGAGAEQPVYLYHSPAGVYQSPVGRPMTGQVGQGYYAVPRMVPDVYREQAVYGVGPPPKLSGYAEGVGMMRPSGVGVGPDTGYTQVAYDSAGRQVYYTTQGGGVMPTYQTVTAASVEVRQTGPLTQESKVATKPSQVS